MTDTADAKAREALIAYYNDPLGVLNGGPTTKNPDAPWIEDAICYALSQGGWNVEPGDGCGIVANMIRDAVAAERERILGQIDCFSWHMMPERRDALRAAIRETPDD